MPSNSQVSTITVTATDNNGGKTVDSKGVAPASSQGKTGGFEDQSATKTLRVPTGVVTVSPDTASTGTVITVTGKGFPAQTNLSALSFGECERAAGAGPGDGREGNFTVTLTVPAAGQGGSLQAGRGGHHRDGGADLGDDLVHHPRALDHPLVGFGAAGRDH